MQCYLKKLSVSMKSSYLGGDRWRAILKFQKEGASCYMPLERSFKGKNFDRSNFLMRRLLKK